MQEDSNTYMRILSILLILTIASCHAFGQESDGRLIAEYKTKSDSLGNLAEFKDAIIYRKKALNLLQIQSPVPYREIVISYRTIGYYLRRWGNYSESFYYQKKAVDVAEINLGENHPELAKAFNGMGGYYYGLQQYAQSLLYFEKALQIGLAINSEDIGDYYNNVGISQQGLGDQQAALATYQKALGYNQLAHGFYHENTADNYENLGTLFYSINQYDRAIQQLDSAEIILDSLRQPGSPDFASVFNNKGVVYNSIGDRRNALLYFGRSLKIYENYGMGDHPEIASIYANIGLLLQEKGDWDAALAYFSRALDIREANLGKINPKVARTHLYLGNCYLEKKYFDKAIEELNLSLQIFKKLKDVDPSEIADVRNGLGNYFESINNHEEALIQYNEALKANASKLEFNDPDVANSYARIGKIYLAQKDYEKAISFFEKAKNIRLDLFGIRHANVADAYRLLALACPLDEACQRRYLEKAFMAIDFHPSKDGHSFEKTHSPITLLNLLHSQAKLLYGLFEKNNNPDYLIRADEINDLAISLINFIKTSLEQPGSRLALQDNYYLVYEEAIFVKHKLKELTGDNKYWIESFRVAELSNTILLMESIQTVDAQLFAGIPDSLIQKERQLRTELSYVEKQRYEEELKNGLSDARVLERINDKIFKLHAQQRELTTYFKENHEGYFKLKYEPKIVSIERIQNKLLRPDQTMLSYFVGDNYLFAFIISKEQFEVVQINKESPLEIWVEEFRNSIYQFNPANPESAYLNQKLANIGYELYQLLFEPIESKLGTESLVIVPGGVLGYLPFDALLATATEEYHDFDNFDYLINKYSISYSYSATLLDEMMRGHHKKKPLIAFAPEYYGDTLNVNRSDDPWRAVLGQLRFNVQEAQSIHTLMGGEIYIDSFATEEMFMKKAPQAGILHLATHGKSNDRHGEYSYLAFYQTADSIENELLFVKNLYNMRIPASMVVLSACETGIGELQRGEGIISLARGFSYAGAASIVTTLWSIDDNASANIMVDFYKNLTDGLPKDIALRNSKVNYIANNIGNNRTHPLFWAAFVPVGNMEPITNGWHWWAWLIAAGTILIGFVLLKNKNSQQ